MTQVMSCVPTPPRAGGPPLPRGWRRARTFVEIAVLDHPLEGFWAGAGLGLLAVAALRANPGMAFVGVLLIALVGTGAIRGGLLADLDAHGLRSLKLPVAIGLAVLWLVLALLLAGPLR
jgi:hypothetical protein